MPIITTLYSVTGHTLTKVPSTGVTIAACQTPGHQFYAALTWNTLPVVLDISRIVAREPRLIGTVLLETYLATALNDRFVAIYASRAIPQKNLSGQYPKRIVSYDPVATSGYTVNAGLMYGNVADAKRLQHYDDLIITGPSDSNFTNSFISVNGVLHYAVSNGSTLYVKDGYKNIRTKGCSTIVIADTTGLGGHTTMALSQSMLEPVITDPWLGVNLNLGSVDLTSSTVLLVIDGTLHILDDSYTLLNMNRLRLDVPRLNLLQDFIHNPNVSFNPPDRILTAAQLNPYLTDQPPAPDPIPPLGIVAADYAGEIDSFFQQIYPDVLQQATTLGMASPAVLLEVGFPTYYRAMQASQFLLNIYPGLSSPANGLTLSIAEPATGITATIQDFLLNHYPLILAEPNQTSPSQAVLMQLSPISSDPAYLIQDVLLNTYPYIAAERQTHDVAFLTLTQSTTEDHTAADAMTQFFAEYYPDLTGLNPDTQTDRVAITDLETVEDYQSSLRGLHGIPISGTQGRSFLYDRLFGPHSFLIIIPKTGIFINRYPLLSTRTAHQFSWVGPDTPRGLLQYDQKHTVPYTILSSKASYHLIHIDQPSRGIDVAQTAIDPVMWPAPQYDIIDAKTPRAAELIELFSA